MFKLLIILSVSVLMFTSPICWSNDHRITKINIVEQLCKETSAEIITEQGIDVIHWQAQHFNGDRTFNIEGVWKTNAGDYIAECELPYGSKADLLALILTKS